MNIHIVYCHPSSQSLTYKVKEYYINGIIDGGNSYTISDLYGKNFKSDISEEEYLLESNYMKKTDLNDVLAEQELINDADELTFIFPIFLMDAPSKLVGWFTRVFTYGYRYHIDGNETMKVIKKVNFLIIMGSEYDDLMNDGKIDAIKTIFGKDRIANKSHEIEFYFFTGSIHEKLNDELKERYLKKAYEIGLNE